MILFIDDELMFNEPYVESLREAGYEVIFEDDINLAIKYFKEKKSQIQLVISDIMMELPQNIPSNFNSNNANFGLRTGEELIRVLNEIDDSIPKILFSNVGDASIYDKYKHSISVAGIYRKKDTSINDLLAIVDQILNKK